MIPLRPLYDLTNKSVYVAGHRGMVGSALVRRLEAEGCQIIVADRKQVDLLDQLAVRDFYSEAAPQVVVIAAAKVGGILANSTYPADFLYQNLQISTNLINGAYESGVEKLLFLGSSCIYPKLAQQPIEESSLLTGSLEETNEPYAIAKIAGIKLAEAFRKQYGCDFISGMPTNLYGINDNYDLETSHVLPALIRKVHHAKMYGEDSITVWGTGTPRREFLHSDDCADACVHLLKYYSDVGHVNIGSGQDLTINELARAVCDALEYDGSISNDLSKPDGTPRKLMCSAKMRALGWKPSIDLGRGIRSAYDDFLRRSAAL